MSRKYEETHPWLTFSTKAIQSDRAELWAMVGECKSKFEHIAGTPLRPDVARQLHHLYLAKGILGTTAIEGNTLSEEEVMKFLDGKLSLPPSREYMAQELKNIEAACNQVRDHIFSGTPMPVNAESLCAMNALVLNGLSLEEGVEPGVIRRHRVGVSRYLAAPAEDCEFLLDRLGGWLDEPQFSEPPSMRTELAIIKAIVAHLYLAWIHPFGDGNGRTARLVELQILLQAGAPTPAAHLLSNHYNQTRTEYYRQLDYASRSNGNIVPFIKYAVRGLLDGLQEQLARIREYQRDLTWLSIVYAAFAGREKEADKRKKHLVLDISEFTEPVKMVEAANVSRRCAAAYARKTKMTLKRDLAELSEMDLIVVDSKGRTVSANKDRVDAFLPRRVSTQVRRKNQ